MAVRGGQMKRKKSARAKRREHARRSRAAKLGWERRRAREEAERIAEQEELYEEKLAELADSWGVDPSDAEDLLRAQGLDVEQYLAVQELLEGAPLTETNRPDPDYMIDLADSFDVNVSALYDIYYGYPPRSVA